MATTDRPNFQKFQEILRKSSSATLPKDTTTVPQLQSSEESDNLYGTVLNESVSEDLSQDFNEDLDEGFNRDPNGDSIVPPFLRQTFRWDEQLRGYAGLEEVPNEDWTVWTTLAPNEISRALVRYERTFDRLGFKRDEHLLIQNDDAVSSFFDENKGILSDYYGSSNGKAMPCRSRRILPYKSKDVTIGERSFRSLFFRCENIQSEIQTTQSESLRQILLTLTDFLDYIFPGSKEGYQNACLNGKVSFPNVWTLFRPGDFVYEKRTIAPYHDVYEQCFEMITSDECISPYDGTRVLRLLLTEIAYGLNQHHNPGPRMVWTTRHIREYDGVKQVTAEDLGILPFSMMASEKRDVVKAMLIQRGRRFFQISKLPFSFWNYKGPYTIVHPLTGPGTIEEAGLSLKECLWQKYTHENVVIDISTSKTHFERRFLGELESFHNSEYNPETVKSCAMPTVEFTRDNCTIEMPLLICRGYLPGYLLSSSVYGAGILISGLHSPVWVPRSLSSAIESSMPDTAEWNGLMYGFFAGSKDLEAQLGRRQAQGSGLIMALEGPKKISAKLEKPLVCMNILDGDLNLEEARTAALRWGAILFIEIRNIPPEQFPDMFLSLRQYLPFYPSVMLVSCNSTKELGGHCEEMIDSVISCRLSSKDEPTALWGLAISEQTPGLSTDISDERLSDICQFLARLEMRETRMQRILTTAKRMAVTERVPLSLKHVVAVIRLSVCPDKLSEFEGVARMGMHKLGYNQVDSLSLLSR